MELKLKTFKAKKFILQASTSKNRFTHKKKGDSTDRKKIT